MSYNVLIQSYCASGQPDQASHILHKMLHAEVKPSVDTFSPLINSFGETGEVDKAKQCLREMEECGLWPKERTYNALLKGLCKAGELKHAQGILDSMLADSLHMERVSSRGGSVRPSATTCGILLNALCSSQQMGQARKLLDKMKWEAIRPTTAIFNILIKGYALSGNLVGAENILREMEGSGEFDCEALGIKPDQVTFTTLMNMWADNPDQGGVQRVRALLEKMKKQDVLLDAVVYGTVMKAYLRGRLPSEAEAVLLEMWEESGIQPQVVAWTTVTAAWVNAGLMDQAERVVEEMQSESCGGRVRPNHMTFHHLIWGYGKYGDPDAAYALIPRMQSVGRQANTTTFRLVQEAFVDNGMPPPADIVEALESAEENSPVSARKRMRARGEDGRLLSTIRSEGGKSYYQIDAKSATMDWQNEWEMFLASADEAVDNQRRSKDNKRWSGRGNNRTMRALPQRESEPAFRLQFKRNPSSGNVFCVSSRGAFAGKQAVLRAPRSTSLIAKGLNFCFLV